MEFIVLDDATVSRLRALTTNVPLFDGGGSIVGWFYPEADKSDYESAKPPISDEELRRRSREGGGRTLDEIMADLEKLK